MAVDVLGIGVAPTAGGNVGRVGCHGQNTCRNFSYIIGAMDAFSNGSGAMHILFSWTAPAGSAIASIRP
jgi:hypothetical protein